MDSKFNLKLKKVEECYISDISFILSDLVATENISLSLEELNKKYLSKSNVVIQCTAVTSGGKIKRCSFKSIAETEYLYCKKHAFKKIW